MLSDTISIAEPQKHLCALMGMVRFSASFLYVWGWISAVKCFAQEEFSADMLKNMSLFGVRSHKFTTFAELKQNNQ